MNPLLDTSAIPIGNGDATNLADCALEDLTKRLAQVESSLLDALQSVAKFTWQMVELVYAQDSFLERCIPLLDPDDHKRFRLAAKAIARFCGILAEHDFDTRTCIREISSAALPAY